MTRIALIADLHANYPAAIEVLKRVTELKCDHVYHLGDAIAIGPHPRDCIELLEKNEVTLMMGNHEEYFVIGLTKPHPHYMSNGEYLHQKWTHSQLNKRIKKWLSRLPYLIHEVYSYDVHHFRIKYDKESLISDLTTREVPDRAFICKTFFKE